MHTDKYFCSTNAPSKNCTAIVSLTYREDDVINKYHIIRNVALARGFNPITHFIIYGDMNHIKPLHQGMISYEISWIEERRTF